MENKSYVDLFAGIGLLDYALQGNQWNLSLALDHEERKFNIFKSHFNGLSRKYLIKDIFNLQSAEFPHTFLCHASFPCTDISSAGSRIGMHDGNESSAIDSLLGILYEKALNQRPSILLTENVKGLLSSNRGKDIRYLLQHYNDLGYQNDLLLLDAKNFVPQSRERIFIISTKPGIIPSSLREHKLAESWIKPKSVLKVINQNLDLKWSFLKAFPKPHRIIKLKDIIDVKDKKFWSLERTNYLYSQMSAKHKRWIDEKLNEAEYSCGTAFRRMRVRDGIKQSTAEIRVDNIAGCLRTAKGGSAKQILIIVGKGEFKVRLLNPLECARLMGAPNFFISDNISKNDYLFGFGDGLCSSVIKWLDDKYLTPIFEAKLPSHHHSTFQHITMDVLLEKDKDSIKENFKDWCFEHKDSYTNLPIKGRLYGALIVLYNFSINSESSPWGFKNTLKVNSTDKGDHFGDRSIKNHTSHKIRLTLTQLGRTDLIPNFGGESGRTSTGTKRAGFDIIQIVNRHVKKYLSSDYRIQGIACVELLTSLVLIELDRHAKMGGIEVAYSPNETIANFLSKIILFPASNSGAILQHLVGAKLEMRYESKPDVIIKHHNSSTADYQINRKGDFDIGNSVIHVTKSPNIDHFRKALSNAKSGRTTYILIPSDRMGLSDSAKDLDKDYKSKVNIFSIEQFLAQNIDEISLFRKEISFHQLRKLLIKYNELIDFYENDSSLKIIIPDFGE